MLRTSVGLVLVRSMSRTTTESGPRCVLTVSRSSSTAPSSRTSCCAQSSSVRHYCLLLHNRFLRGSNITHSVSTLPAQACDAQAGTRPPVLLPSASRVSTAYSSPLSTSLSVDDESQEDSQMWSRQTHAQPKGHTTVSHNPQHTLTTTLHGTQHIEAAHPVPSRLVRLTLFSFCCALHVRLVS